MEENKEIVEEEKETPKKKGNGLFTLFACIMTGVIVFLAMNIGQKASKVVDPDVKSGGKKSNVTSNVESNATSNATSNTTQKLEYRMTRSVDVNKKDIGVIRAISNGQVVWEYKTAAYDATELEPFTLYEGTTYVYVAENGIVKSFAKDSGSLVWTSTANVGKSTELLELNGKVYAIGSYKKGLSILDISNGNLDKEVSISPITNPTHLAKLSDTVVKFND